MRPTVKNRVHALLDERGLRCPYSNLFGKKGKLWLRGLELDALDRLMLDNHLSHMESLDKQVGEWTRRSVDVLAWTRMSGCFSA